jgi:hypothetical protein
MRNAELKKQIRVAASALKTLHTPHSPFRILHLVLTSDKLIS